MAVLLIIMKWAMKPFLMLCTVCVSLKGQNKNISNIGFTH